MTQDIRVLVADDEAIIRHSLQFFLPKIDRRLDVLVAENLGEMVEHLVLHQPQVLVLDVSFYGGIPEDELALYAWTRFAVPTVFHHGDELGLFLRVPEVRGELFFGVVPKPARDADLVDAIHTALSRQRAKLEAGITPTITTELSAPARSLLQRLEADALSPNNGLT